MLRRRGICLAGIIGIGALLSIVGSVGGDEVSADIKAGRVVFARNCSACHTVGAGTRIGPDLAGVGDRRSTEWLVKWIEDPVRMARTDPIARRLVAEWNYVQMADMGLSREQIDQVLAYIDYAGERSVRIAESERAPSPGEPSSGDTVSPVPAAPLQVEVPGVVHRHGGHRGPHHMTGRHGHRRGGGRHGVGPRRGRVHARPGR